MATALETDHLSSSATVELFKKYVIANYNRYPVSLVKGEDGEWKLAEILCK